jgi:Lrp/AsnC family transcriptional regulator, leucine-responsive regulatory protein
MGRPGENRESRTGTLDRGQAPRTLDEIDLRLLRALWQDGRARVRALARELDLADSAVSVRLRRLRDTGVLAGVHAEVDPAVLGLGTQALVGVRLSAHVTFPVYEARLRTMRSVLGAVTLVGEFDLEVHLACRDMPDLERALAELRSAGAETTRTQLIARTVTGLGRTLLGTDELR